jgi:hypothetical protein
MVKPFQFSFRSGNFNNYFAYEYKHFLERISDTCQEVTYTEV